ncbi:hypothetical protein CDV55_108898 [Aspergillus turcosus]|uniref:Uncharacterized protein n=1 Tax=Aspergillus turcosus TaxID=1245748 RepID=A0A229XEK9_9EURO|nr:hypothetical protein CDV55_108898 [Aspergillus turcosus]RLL99511.1 hypothetical protein CFD26_107406 [Aspergillus turcosus]
MLNSLASVEAEEAELPWGIRQSGFDESNCLVWLADPRHRNFSRISQSNAVRAVLSNTFLQYNQQVIQHSNLRVIILDANDTAQLVLSTSVQANPFKIPLYCGEIGGFLEILHGEVQRVYLQCPSSLTGLWANPGPNLQKMSEIFKYAAALTHTHGIRPYFCNSASAVYHILRTYHEERNGAEKMTISNINPIIHAFIFRKGFRNEEDISRLETIGGSLTRGLLLLLFTLRRTPNKSHKPNAVHQEIKGRVHRENVLDQNELYEMDQLYAGLNIVTPTHENEPNGALSVSTSKSPGSTDHLELTLVKSLVEAKGKAVIKECGLGQEEQDLAEAEINDIDAERLLKDVFPESDEDDREPDLVQFNPDSQCQVLVSPTVFVRPKSICTKTGHPNLRDRHREEILSGIIYPGKKHPERWAIDAQDDDPGSKLAFLVTLSHGPRFVYAHGECAARKANTFMDLMIGDTPESIALRPRRHINANDPYIARTLNLSDKGTWYTDNRGTLIKSKPSHAGRVTNSIEKCDMRDSGEPL